MYHCRKFDILLTFLSLIFHIMGKVLFILSSFGAKCKHYYILFFIAKMVPKHQIAWQTEIMLQTVLKWKGIFLAWHSDWKSMHGCIFQNIIACMYFPVLAIVWVLVLPFIHILISCLVMTLIWFVTHDLVLRSGDVTDLGSVYISNVLWIINYFDDYHIS